MSENMHSGNTKTDDASYMNENKIACIFGSIDTVIS